MRDTAGWKIALRTSKAMQQMTGVDQPAAGAIFSATIYPSPAPVALGAYHHLGIEFEVAVRLAGDLPASKGPWTRASVAEHVAACLPAFELVEDGDADYKMLDAFTLVAENAWNGGVVLGAPGHRLAPDRPRDRRDPGLGEDRLSPPARAGPDALGHPLEAVAWLANLLNARGRMLASGHLVMTGSSITTKFPAPGDRVRFAIDGLGVDLVSRPTG